jgi:peptidyl-prolyl cis-trans isomerase B (cyclophilin B)
MKKIFFALLSLLIISCSNDSEGKKSEISKKKKVLVKKVKKKKVLTSENAVEFLTKYGKENPETELYIHTNYGSMKVKLYEDTPLHRANFIYLAKEKYWNDTYFHRVVNGFMIQGGNTDNWGTSGKRAKIGTYKIPNEIKPERFHKKGALSASRSYIENPEKKTAPFEFFIVQGHTFSKGQLEMLEEQYKKKVPEFAKKVYYKSGGTPHLDKEHTVFGELTEGFDVLDKIAAVETDKGEWPIKNVVMNIEIIK